MNAKETDPRIKEFTDFWFKIYEDKYKRKPQWSGKEAKLLQSILKSFGSREMDTLLIYRAMESYLKDDGFAKANVHAFSIFATNPDKYLPLPEDQRAQKEAERIVERVKQVFSVDEPINHFELEDLVHALGALYPPTEEGCQTWMKGQKFLKRSTNMEEGSKLHNNWIRAGQAARLYFGNELVEAAWKGTKTQKPEIENQEKLTKE